MSKSHNLPRISAGLVLFSVTVVLFLATGILKSLSVLLPVLREQFVTQTWVIGLTISMIPGIGSIACLFLPMLRHIMDPGYTVMITGLRTDVGFILGSLATHIALLVLALIIPGFSIIAEVIATGILSNYFKKHYNVAISIALGGISCGLMVMPSITQVFLETYGWRGAMLLLSALSSHITVCGVVIKHCELERIREEKQEYTRISTHSSEWTKTEFMKKPENEDSARQSNKRLLTYISSKLDLHLFKNITFVGVLIAAACHGFSYVGWIIYLIPHAEERGVQAYSATLLATAGGVGNIVAKLCYPLFEKVLSIRLIMYSSSVVMAMSLIADTWFPSLTGRMVTSIIFGLAGGTNTVGYFAVANKTFERESMINTVAWIYFSYGVASIMGGYTIGILFDVTGTYNASFILMGAVVLTQPCYYAIEDIISLLQK